MKSQGVINARRHFLRDCGIGLGKMALATALCRESTARASSRQIGLGPHHGPRAKAVIHLFMAGAPSQLDLFDYKPKLVQLEGRPMPPEVIGSQRFAFIRGDAGVLGPRFKFARHGASGAELSEMIPNLSQIVDRICLVKSVHTDQFNHAPAQIFFNTGFAQPGRPCIGSWVIYGLGAMSDNLPSFVVMSTGSGISGGVANWSSGFLPSVHAGVRFRNQGDAILHTSTPKGIDNQSQRQSLDLIQAMNRERQTRDHDPEIATRISAYEMAFRLQSSAPELMDLSRESKSTLEMYGADPATPSFARACLLARRMVERGVRFINIYHEGWDAHSDVAGNLRKNCGQTDRASAALVLDLAQRGMLDDTLVIWGGEFGRTPMVETNASLGRSLGRDHHPHAFTMWFAGGGMKQGSTLGETDELGYSIIRDPVHVHDLQATILHCLGLDHERLTYRHAGRDFRLTDVHGKLVEKILA